MFLFLFILSYMILKCKYIHSGTYGYQNSKSTSQKMQNHKIFVVKSNRYGNINSYFGDKSSIEPIQYIWYPLVSALYHCDIVELQMLKKIKQLLQNWFQPIMVTLGSIDQADPSCFYFRISWMLIERPWFYVFCPLDLLQGLGSLKNWLLQKLSMNILDQKF